MRLQLTIAGRLHSVEVRRAQAGYEVIVDGRPRMVEAVRIGSDTWSLLVREGGGATRSVDAAVTHASGAGRGGNGAVEVYVDGHVIPVEVRAGAGRRSPERSAGPGGTEQVTAPMPGRIVRVLVAPGDVVGARQGLVVIEAMKMENEMRASRPGRVSQVLVHEGQPVESGAALVVLE